jgi:hypothetical protein
MTTPALPRAMTFPTSRARAHFHALISLDRLQLGIADVISATLAPSCQCNSFDRLPKSESRASRSRRSCVDLDYSVARLIAESMSMVLTGPCGNR